MASILENLKELKDHLKEMASVQMDHLKEAASEKMENFNKKMHDVYDALSHKISGIETEAKDKNDQTISTLSKQYADLKAAFHEYKDKGSEKAEQAREAMVDKLHQLNEKIEEYNKDKRS